MKAIGVTINNELVCLRDGRVVIFCPVNQEQIDDRNTLDYARDMAGYCISDEDLQGELDAIESGYGDSIYFGHDTSYISEIPKEIYEHFYEVVTFECVGSGGNLHNFEFVKIFDQMAIDSFAKPKPKKFKLTLVGA